MRLAVLALALSLAALGAVGCSAGAGEPEPPETPEPPAKPPVIVLVFDEFPTDDLLVPGGSIDAQRFPNFARLARTSTWFPNAHTAYDSTFKAVPDILDALEPRRGTAPDARSHPRSIYDVVHRLGYGVITVESASALCPERICPGSRTRRPGVLRRLAGGGRSKRLHKWIGAIRRRPEPTFYFHHSLLPHEPWLYLPSGHQSRPYGEDPVNGINQPKTFDDVHISRHNHLRHLLQVGFLDRELGLLMRRLRRTRQFRDALLIVTADHGYSFEMNTESRRLVSETNVEQVATVPLFIKLPGQTDGEVDRSIVRNIDIAPTIAEVLGTSLRYRHDGRSVFSEDAAKREIVSLPTRDFRQTIRIGVQELERRREQRRREWAELFGTGEASEREFGDPWEAAYRVGPRPELLGRRVASLPRAASGGVTGKVRNARLLRRVDLADQIRPTRVTGPLFGSPPRSTRDVAVAVNGRIRATTHTFRLQKHRPEFFSLIVPESALRPGRNRVEVFEVRADGRLALLARG